MLRGISRALLLSFLALLSQKALAGEGDPVLDAIIGHQEAHADLAAVPAALGRAPTDSIPPELTVAHTENGDQVTIYVTSTEDLYTGWVPGAELWSDPNWDYWWLNTRIARDPDQCLFAAVKLYEYSSPSNDFDMFALENNGAVSGSFPEWNGPGGNPLVVNNPDPNIYIHSPTLDRQGAVDPQTNITYIFYNNGGSDVIFTKIAADGTLLVDGQVIITGANAWTNEIATAIDPSSRIYLVWSDSMHDITVAHSDDEGASWSTPASICSDSVGQLNKPQVRCDSSGNVHIIWQHWTGGSNRLSYMKLNPDGSISIDESFLTPASNQVWSPRMDIDEEDNFYVVWANSSQQVTSAYFTKINGSLDGGGGSMSDDTLTIIPEEAFLSSQLIRYPKCVADAYWNVHVVYESGQYGRFVPKAMCYMKRNSIPLLRLVCPDESVIFIEMTGAGSEWEGTFTPPEDGTYSLLASGSDVDGNTGTASYSFEFPDTGIGGDESGPDLLSLSVRPNPVVSTSTISYSLPEACAVQLTVFDTCGRLVATLQDGSMPSGSHSVVWHAEGVAPGIYFCRIVSGDFRATEQFAVIE